MDLPDDADIYETKLRDGDLIIAYVRGLILSRLFASLTLLR